MTYHKSGMKARALTAEEPGDHKSVEIIYSQTSTYKTTDPTVTLTDVVQEPFATMLSRSNYLSFQQIRSSQYAQVSFVSPVAVPQQREEASSEGGLKQGVRHGLFASLGILLLLAVYLVAHRKRRDRMLKHFWGLRRMPTLLTVPEGQEERNDGKRSGSFARSEETIDIIALPGRVGCVIHSSPQRGPFVCEIQEMSPLKGDIQLGDRIVAVDNEDVHQMSAVDVSKLLGRRSNSKRRITVLRGNSSSLESGPGDAESSTGAPQSLI